MPTFRLPKLTKNTRRLLNGVVFALIAYFFIQVLAKGTNDIAGRLHDPHWWLLIGGGVGFGLYYLFRFFMWQRLFADTQHTVGFLPTARMLMLSDVARFIPGNIWSVVGRVVAAEKFGISKTQTVVSTAVETLALFLSALVVTGIIGIFSPLTPGWIRLLSIAAVLGGVVYVTLGHWLERAIKFLIKRVAPDIHNVSFHRNAFYGSVGWCIVAWFFYTLGGVLLTRAFFDLSPKETLAVATALPLSWLIGYLSFITPSGLGFREAAFVGLISPLLGSNAALIALLTRFGFIVTEFAWVVAVAWRETVSAAQWVWRKLKTPRGIVIMACIAFALYFSFVTVTMHSKVITSRFDLGNMDQIVWNTSQGRFFQFTNPYATETVSRYIHHADIFLVLFAPIYWVYASPNVLLVAQALIIALGGWYVFRLAKRVLGHEWLAAALALAFLFYPTIQRAVLFDFHSVTLAATFSIAFVLAYVERRWKAFALFAVLIAMCKEELPLMVASVALLMLWRDWRDISVRKIALTTLGLSVLYFGFTYFAIMPAMRGGAASKYVVQYDVLGTTPKEMLLTVRDNPKLLVAMLGGSQARHMYAGQLGPVGFLPLASPLWLAAAWPDYVVNLFNERIETRLLIYHYQTAIGGFVFISSIFGIAFLRKKITPFWNKRIIRFTKISFETALIVYILIVAGIESYRLSPLPYSQTKDMRVFWRAPMAPIIHSAIAEVPVSAKVSATNTVGAQLAHREHLYQFPNGVGDADYIFVLLAPVNSLEWKRNHVQAEALAKDPRYQVYAHEKNFTAYRRR